MEINARNQSVAELKAEKAKLVWVIVGMGVALAALSLKLVFQSEIVIQRTPGMPNDAVIEKTAMDKGAQRATLFAVTSAIAQVNPANAEYQKMFVQAYLSPEAYTRVSRDIDVSVARLANQRELGSYYFVLGGYEYDPVLNRHFVWGEVHTVNAAHDTAEAYTYEYKMHIENYRAVVDDVKAYTGKNPHNSEWLKASKK